MKFVASNNASALVVGTVGISDVTIALETGAGSLFPVLNTGEYFLATLYSTTAQREIVKVTEHVGDTMTVQRAQEATPAQTFAAGSRFECRLTAGMVNGWLQRAGDSMQGDLDMAGFAIANARFGDNIVFNIIHAALIRSPSIPAGEGYTPAENSIYLPPRTSPSVDERRPSYMGRAITNTFMFDGVIHDWFGDVNHLPSHFRLCNGQPGTPDMRGRYVKGWTDTFGVGGYGGHESTRPDPTEPFGFSYGLPNDPAGAHAHDADVQPHTLIIAEMPIHHHNLTQASGILGNTGTGISGTDGPRATTDQGGGQPHDHGITVDPVGDHMHWIHVPPFIVVAKVMFTL